MTTNSPIVQSTYIEIPIVNELIDLAILLWNRPIALIAFGTIFVMGYFVFRD